jgi:hypothetical protein
MASDFSVAWQFLSKRTIGLSLRIKLHAHLRNFFRYLLLHVDHVFLRPLRVGDIR